MHSILAQIILVVYRRILFCRTSGIVFLPWDYHSSVCFLDRSLSSKICKYHIYSINPNELFYIFKYYLKCKIFKMKNQSSIIEYECWIIFIFFLIERERERERERESRQFFPFYKCLLVKKQRQNIYSKLC